MFLTADMFPRSRKNIKAHQPIAAAVDNRGNSLSNTSHVDPLVGKVICTVCTACSSHLEAMSGDELESVSSFEDTLMGTAGGALPVLNNIWECPLINMSVREEKMVCTLMDGLVAIVLGLREAPRISTSI